MKEENTKLTASETLLITFLISFMASIVVSITITSILLNKLISVSNEVRDQKRISSNVIVNTTFTDQINFLRPVDVDAKVRPFLVDIYLDEKVFAKGFFVSKDADILIKSEKINEENMFEISVDDKKYTYYVEKSLNDFYVLKQDTQELKIKNFRKNILDFKNLKIGDLYFAYSSKDGIEYLYYGIINSKDSENLVVRLVDIDKFESGIYYVFVRDKFIGFLDKNDKIVEYPILSKFTDI